MAMVGQLVLILLFFSCVSTAAVGLRGCSAIAVTSRMVVSAVCSCVSSLVFESDTAHTH